MLIARYTTNASGVVPTFNEGYQYTLSETESNGVYTVELNSESEFTSCSFNSISSLLTVEYLKVTSNVNNMSLMFYNCNNLTSLDVSNWDTSKVIDMNFMFHGCTSLNSLDLSSWDTGNVVYMQEMFNSCTNLTTLDVSNFNTSNVTHMQGMLNGCKSLTSLDVSNFDTSKVIRMDYMFYGCTNLTSLDLSSWDTGNVTNMYAMFYNCTNLTSLDLGNFDTGNVTNMVNMFYNCNNLTSLDLSNFNTSKVIYTYNMFNYCRNLTSLNISNWDTSNVIDMSFMFSECNNLTTLDLSNWNTSNVTTMREMFAYCYKLTTLDLSNFNISNVTNMQSMFYGCNNLIILDLSNWDMSKVTSKYAIFTLCKNLTKIRLLNCNINTLNRISDLTSTDLYVDRDLDISTFSGTNKLFGVRQEIKELPELHHGQEIVKIDGKYYIYHTYGKVVLDGSEDEEWTWEGDTNYTHTCISTYFIKDMVNYTWTDITEKDHSNYVMCDKYKTIDVTYHNWTEEVENVSLIDFGRIVFRINKTKLHSINESAFREYLQANPITVIYKLAEPYYEEITLDELMKVYIRPTNVKIKNSSNIKIQVKVVK